MELIREISENDVLEDGKDYTNTSFNVRKTSRGVIVNNENKIALLYVSKENYYKLPGGGMEQGEDPLMAFTREIREETGTDVEIKNYMGVIIEYKNKLKKLQISYCYTARVIDETGDPEFSKKEKNKGFILKWVNFNEALNLIKSQKPKDYSGKFITLRDATILEKTREALRKE